MDKPCVRNLSSLNHAGVVEGLSILSGVFVGAATHVNQKTVRQKLLNLRSKSAQFQMAYDFPNAYRTSNTLDRLMNYQDRLLYNMQYFHGTLDSARMHLRAMALLWNFHPYGSRTKTNAPNRFSPFEDLNGFRASRQLVTQFAHCGFDEWLLIAVFEVLHKIR